MKNADRLLDLGFDLDLLALVPRSPVSFGHVVEVLSCFCEEDPSYGCMDVFST